LSDLADDLTFQTWVNAHLDRVGHHGLPAPDSPEGETKYSAWQRHLVAKGVTFADAEAASWEMVARDGIRPFDHFATLLKLAVGARNRRLERGRPETVPLPGIDDRADWQAWEALSDEERAARVAAMGKRFPSLSHWRGFLVNLCVDEIGGRLEPGAADPPGTEPPRPPQRQRTDAPRRRPSAPCFDPDLVKRAAAVPNVAYDDDGNRIVF
jgi:hypothetical protein